MGNENEAEFNLENLDFNKLIEKHGRSLSTTDKNMVLEAFKKIEEGNSIQQALEFTPEMMEVIYQHGYQLFQSGKYNDALAIFKLLYLIDPFDKRYLFSIAASNHYVKNYWEAGLHYLFYAGRDLQNPIPYFHAYDCFLKGGNLLLAANMLDESLRLAKLQPQHQNLAEKIQLELNYFKENHPDDSLLEGSAREG